LGSRIDVDGRSYLNLSTNDYLNLGRDQRLITRAGDALQKIGVGASASRLVTGTHVVHRDLEAKLARFIGFPASLICGAGYLANLAALSALANRQDTIVADKLVHASIIDAAKLSGAKLVRFRHNDTEHLEQTLCRCSRNRQIGEELIVVTESVFSMDGDCAPLKDICKIAKSHGAVLMVDDAHALGVFGEKGQGLVAELGLSDEVDVLSTTLSKAMGCYGGALLVDETIRKWLVNTARPFIYNTGLPPAMAAAGVEAISILEKEPGLGKRVLAAAQRFRSVLNQAGLNTLQSSSQIVPVVVGDNETTLSFSAALFDKGIIGVPIRTPTVPEGSARIRFSLTAAISVAEAESAAGNIVEIARHVLPKLTD
jgi:8-amino-7-oxononanoate synthase